MQVTLIGLDADDTLWHHEVHFRMTQERLVALLAPYGPVEAVTARLEAAEKTNLAAYGYGAKGFTLSMIETALDVSGGRIPGAVVAEILAAGRALMQHPIEPLPGVADALQALAARGRLVLITKGDLHHQESKLAASGLGEHFAAVEIVSEKSPETYRRIFARHGAGGAGAVMAGNSVRSDILPALEAGAHAALIPYPLVWSHEAALAPVGHPRFVQLDSLADLPAWLGRLEQA